jgi:plastocyanin
MGRVGRIAIPVIMGVAAVTGVLAFFIFQQVTPGHTIFTPSMFFQPLPPQLIQSEPISHNGDFATSTAGANASQTNNTSQIPANAVTIHILQGAAVQGSPNFQPDKDKASGGSTVVWINDDTASHTVTSGTGPQDPNAGKQFDSGMIAPGAHYSIAASKIGSGEHPYFCQIHPFMKGSITIS